MSFQHPNAVGKSLFVRDTSGPKVTMLQAGIGGLVGGALAARGIGRSGMIGRALSRGMRQAGTRGNDRVLTALQLAQAAQGSMSRGTTLTGLEARRVARVYAALNQVPQSIRSDVSTAAGSLMRNPALQRNVNPFRRTVYRPVGVNIRIH